MVRKVLFLVSLFASSIVVAQTTTVYFDFNSFMINNEARSILNKFIASGKITSVGFFGHTDQSGRAEYNEWLSVQRALAVKDYLLSKGLKENNVSVVRGFGAERLITTAPDSASQQLNRRVAITIGYKATPTDIAAQTKQTPIYYSTSPSLPKDLADSSAVTLTADTKQAVAINQTNTTAEEKKNLTDSPAANIKQLPVNDQKSITAQTKETPVAKDIRPTSDTLTTIPITKTKETPLNNEAKATADVKETSTKESSAKETSTKETATKEPPKQTEVSGEEKESFASRLSKAVSKTPAVKPANASNTATPENSSTAPVVKQQKHEKLIEDINDKDTKEGEHIVLRHIHFYGGRHAFLPQAYPALDDLLETMQKVPTLQIEIQGHICCQDGEGDQIDFDSGEPVLSVTRAKAVYDFLVENGVDKKRMTYKGLAHKFPIIKVETNEEEATINRRVEIKIIKK